MPVADIPVAVRKLDRSSALPTCIRAVRCILVTPSDAFVHRQASIHRIIGSTPDALDEGSVESPSIFPHHPTLLMFTMIMRCCMAEYSRRPVIFQTWQGQLQTNTKNGEIVNRLWRDLATKQGCLCPNMQIVSNLAMANPVEKLAHVLGPSRSAAHRVEPTSFPLDFLPQRRPDQALNWIKYLNQKIENFSTKNEKLTICF